MNDYFGYFLSESEDSPNPMCDPNPKPYTKYAYLIKSCIIN